MSDANEAPDPAEGPEAMAERIAKAIFLSHDRGMVCTPAIADILRPLFEERDRYRQGTMAEAMVDRLWREKRTLQEKLAVANNGWYSARLRAWKTLPADDGDGGETWAQAYADLDMSTKATIADLESRLARAVELLKNTPYPSHANHFDREGTSGLNCPACNTQWEHMALVRAYLSESQPAEHKKG